MTRRPPRLTRKPLPRARKAWEREVAGVRRFLRQLERLDPDLLGGWPGKQQDYYQKRLQDLESHPPYGIHGID